MVAECKLFYAALTDSIVERTTAHFGAQRTGVILIADIENYLLDIGLEAGVGNVTLLAHFAYGLKIHALEAKLDGYRLKLKMLGIVALQVL